MGKKTVSKSTTRSKKSPKVKAKIVPVSDEHIPVYQTAGSACADLVAHVTGEVGNRVSLPSRRVTKIDTGIRVQVPEGYKLCVSARSGLASRGVIVTNAPGQVDSDYRGRVMVIVANCGNQIVNIENGQRFAQCWIEPVYKFDWEVISEDELEETDRGEGGFGSTGD